MASFDDGELALRRSRIAAVGLPCLVVGVKVEGEFASVVLEPMDGWTHMVPDDALADFAALGYVYHVSLGYNIGPELLETIDAQWADVETVISISWVRDSNVAMLSWAEGLGGDPSLWAALAQGYPGRDFGLHISM